MVSIADKTYVCASVINSGTRSSGYRLYEATVLVRVPTAAMNTMTKESWGEKGLFGLYFQIIVHHWRKLGQKLQQGKNLEAGVDAEVVEETLNGLLPLVCSAHFL